MVKLACQVCNKKLIQGVSPSPPPALADSATEAA